MLRTNLFSSRVLQERMTRAVDLATRMSLRMIIAQRKTSIRLHLQRSSDEGIEKSPDCQCVTETFSLNRHLFSLLENLYPLRKTLLSPRPRKTSCQLRRQPRMMTGGIPLHQTTLEYTENISVSLHTIRIVIWILPTLWFHPNVPMSRIRSLSGFIPSPPAPFIDSWTG